MFCIALSLAALALGGCLQDADNADKNFDFNNVNDPNATSSNTIAIAAVDYLSTTQTVVIVNQSGTAQDMTSWLLVNEVGPETYTFGSFTLAAGAFVRVHPVTGTDTTTDLYSGPPGPTSPSWAATQVAILQNSGGVNVSACTVGSPTC